MEGVEKILAQAGEYEKRFDWLGAVEFYEKVLRIAQGVEADEKSLPAELAVNTWERMGSCYSLASRQAANSEEFKKLTELASHAYRRAVELLDNVESLRDQGRSPHCSAVAEHLDSWLARTPGSKKEMLDRCLTFGKKSLEAFERAGDQLSYVKACNDFLLVILERLYVASDSREMLQVAKEGVSYANEAVEAASRHGNKEELTRAFYASSLVSWYAANISEQENERKELIQNSLGHADKALDLSREVGNPYHTAMSNWAGGISTLLFTEKIDVARTCAEEMLKQAAVVKDQYLQGVAYYVLAMVCDWTTLREADPDKKQEGRENIIKYSENALRHLEIVCQDFFIAETSLYYVESYSSQALEVESNRQAKRALLDKALEVGRKGLEHAIRSGSPDATGSALHALSKALHFSSNLETEKEAKSRLLEEALERRQEYNRIVEQAFPSVEWISGHGKNYEGQIRADMAKLEEDNHKKRELLESAVFANEEGLSRCRRWVLSRPVPSYIASLAALEDGFGRVLSELYSLNQDRKTLRRAVDVYEDAAKNFKKVNLSSRVAESYWKAARSQDRLNEHHKASESFANAFEQYKIAAETIPHFGEFYLDHATYMQAWSEIENASAAHYLENYAEAMKHYEKSADLLNQTKLWSYLSPNFSAWSLLEAAENLSRKEKTVESIAAFKKASELYQKAKDAFDGQIGKIKSPDELEQAVQLSKASAIRIDYCSARVNIEEAIARDRKGEHSASAEKYGLAASRLEEISSATQTETDQKEVNPILYMCRAWQKMKLADAKDSAELYAEASQLFLKAKDYSTKERSTLLASGNSAYCKALEYGTRFESERNSDDFSKAKQFLANAANYYLKAGLDNASVWANATEMLFDAYNYMIGAEVEIDPEKKMRIFLFAEKCLERSVRLYETAGYVGKRDEVQRIMDKVKEKREFALSLGELLTAPSDASSTRFISAPGMTVEEPVGFLKFERAFVQANVVAHQREIMIGQNFELEIHLVNLGKTAAFLLRAEGVVPEGFDLMQKPEKCVLSDGTLSFRGKKLAPLETMEMNLTFKAKKKGKFTLAPNIQFMDEAGEYKPCALEPVSIDVKELGIRGWLKGQG
jgi:hypothetical protein